MDIAIDTLDVRYNTMMRMDDGRVQRIVTGIRASARWEHHALTGHFEVILTPDEVAEAMALFEKVAARAKQEMQQA